MKVYLIWNNWGLEDKNVFCVVENIEKAKEIAKKLPNHYIEEKVVL